MDAGTKKTVRIAAMNLAPGEEDIIRSALQAAGSAGHQTSRYILLGNSSVKEAEIVIANLKTQDLDRTNQLLRRVYGVKSTIFLVGDADVPQGSGYKYIISRKDLDQSLMSLLDAVTRDELDAEYRMQFLNTGSDTASSAVRTVNNAVPEKPAAPARSQSVGRALVVDDSPSIRTQMSLYLGKRNFDCQVAGNSEEAIRAIRQSRFDIIFLDVVMPGADGYQACKAIKSLEATRQVPVILLTSKNSPIDKIHGIMSGCDKYLTKPLRVTDLESLLCSYFPALGAAPAAGN
jgi:two-component system, cell cycle response regulator